MIGISAATMRSGPDRIHAQRSGSRGVALALAACGLVLAGCAGSAGTSNAAVPPTTTVAADDSAGCADVVNVAVTLEDSGTYRFDVTVRSADTGPEKYADLWEVRAPDGTVLGKRVLTHPHVDEQPFTRSQGGIAVPAEIGSVTVVARDSVAGFCGIAGEVEVP